MRTTSRILIRFILWLVALSVISAALVVAHGYVTGFDSVGATTAASFVSLLTTAFTTVLLGCTLGAAAITCFSVLRHADHPLLPLILLVASAAGMIILSAFLQSAEGSADTTVVVLGPGQIERVGSLRFYAVTRDGVTYEPAVIHDAQDVPGFRVYPRLTSAPSGSGFLDPATGELITADIREGSLGRLVEPPPLLGPVLRDLALLGRGIALDGTGVQPAWALIAALVVFLLSLWTWVRMTTWPLFNAVMVFSALRFAIWFNGAVTTGSLRQLMIAAFGSHMLGYVSAVGIGGIGLLIVAASVLLPPYAQWRKEVSGD